MNNSWLREDPKKIPKLPIYTLYTYSPTQVTDSVGVKSIKFYLDDDSVSCVYGATQNVLKLKSDGTDVAASRSTAGDTTAGGAAAKRKRRDTDTDVDTDITVGEKNVEPEPATEASSSGGDQPETAKAQRKQG